MKGFWTRERFPGVDARIVVVFALFLFAGIVWLVGSRDPGSGGTPDDSLATLLRDLHLGREEATETNALHPGGRRFARVLLELSKRPDLEEDFHEALRSDDPDVSAGAGIALELGFIEGRIDAAAALNHWSQAIQYAVLSDVLLDDPAAAARALPRIGEILTGGGTGTATARAAIAVIGRHDLRSEATDENLVFRVLDEKEDPAVRLAAARAFRGGTVKQIERLTDGIGEDKGAATVDLCVVTLSGLRPLPEAAEATLISLAVHGDGKRSVLAAEALAIAGSRSARVQAALRDALLEHRGDQEGGRRIVAALEKVGLPADLQSEEFEELLRHPDPNLRTVVGRIIAAGRERR